MRKTKLVKVSYEGYYWTDENDVIDKNWLDMLGHINPRTCKVEVIKPETVMGDFSQEDDGTYDAKVVPVVVDQNDEVVGVSVKRTVTKKITDKEVLTVEIK